MDAATIAQSPSAHAGGPQRAYGITLAEYHAMVARQDGLCALCERRPVEKLCLDHCHDMQMLRMLRLSAIIGTLSGLRRSPVRNASDSAVMRLWSRTPAQNMGVGRAS